LPVDVYTARVLDPPFDVSGRDYGGNYSFANFDMNGPVEVSITARQTVSNSIIRPLSRRVSFQVKDEHTLTFALDKPCKLSIEPSGKNDPLLLFANPMEAERPDLSGPDVVYFGPGIHRPDKIVVTNGQSLYLAGGAVVKGGVIVDGDDVRIAGRGILDGSDYKWRTGPTPHVLSMTGSRIEVCGITIRGASHWTIAPNKSNDVTIRNVKICGARVQNDDGIDICNSQNVLITDCFLRTDDDCVALKGMGWGQPPWKNIENVRVENSVFWCDRARVFLLGHESRADYMQNITFSNLDIIHFNMTPFLLEPGEEMMLKNVTVENIRIYGEGQEELIRLRPMVNKYMQNKVPGHIQDISFRNLTVFGEPGQYMIRVLGSNETHQVENVRFENVEILNNDLSIGSDALQTGPYAENIFIE